MKLHPVHLLAAGLALTSAAARADTKPLSDLASPEKRRVVVDLALRLTRPPEPVPVPADLPQPFSPAGFDQPDPEEVKAAALAKGVAAAAGGGNAAAGPTQAARQPADREILENLAGKLQTTGYLFFNGEALLTLGRNRVRVGDHFGVEDKLTGQVYELELIAIDRTTFTLRYHGEEFTRAIRAGK